MLTIAKMLVLLHFNWKSIRFRTHGAAAETQLLADIDWRKYASLLQDLTLTSKKIVSPEYARVVHRQPPVACADKTIAQTFIGYASTL